MESVLSEAVFIYLLEQTQVIMKPFFAGGVAHVLLQTLPVHTAFFRLAQPSKPF